MSKTTNRFSPEIRARAVRMVLDHEREHACRWAAVVSITAKIGCAGQTLHEWIKKAEIDSGMRAGVPSDVADRTKALEREAGEARQALRNLIELITAEPKPDGRGIDLLVHGRVAQIFHIANDRPNVSQGGRFAGAAGSDYIFRMVAGTRTGRCHISPAIDI